MLARPGGGELLASFGRSRGWRGDLGLASKAGT